MEYEYLPHTADVKIRAFGRDFADACRSAARAYTDLLTDVHKVAPKRSIEVRLRAKGKESLLYDFLDELVYRKDAEGFVPCEAQLTLREGNGEWELSGTVRGDALENYEHSGDVKAATYHDMHIEERNGNTTLEFVLDI